MKKYHDPMTGDVFKEYVVILRDLLKKYPKDANNWQANVGIYHITVTDDWVAYTIKGDNRSIEIQDFSDWSDPQNVDVTCSMHSHGHIDKNGHVEFILDARGCFICLIDYITSLQKDFYKRIYNEIKKQF